MSLLPQFSPQARAEQAIAVARVALAAASMLALAIDPSEPTRYVAITRMLTIGYTVWAVAVFLISRSMVLPRYWQLSTHAVDLVVCLLVMNLTAGPDSPFFLYLVFALMSATLRWHVPGALWTGGAALVVFFGTVVRRTPVEVNVVVLRATYLAVLALMLAYLGQYGAYVRRTTQRLRTWQPSVGDGVATIMGEAVRYVADVVGAPRAAIVWEEPDEPDLRMVWWSDGPVSMSREYPVALQPLVARPFERTDFLCRDASTVQPTVIFASASGLQSAQGPAIHPQFVADFAVRSLLAVECTLGRLLLVDKAQLTTDDLWLAQIVARQVSSSVDQVLLRRQLEESKIFQARAGVARDLHDGVLQSLTAITLRLESMGRAVDVETRRRIESLQAMIGDEARRLRRFIQELTSRAPETTTEALAERLESLGEHLQRDWDLRVELDTVDLTRIPIRIAPDIYFVVREALINVARHAGASMARATIAIGDGRLRVAIADDGHGFPFEGSRDGVALLAANLAPRMLYERVTALGGRLVVDSGTEGSRLDIEVPLPQSEPR